MTFRPAAVGILALTACMPACSREGGQRRFMSIGTAGTGGVYYPLGGAIASRLSVLDSATQFTAEVTGGSVENINRVASGEMDMGFSMATSVYEAYNGGPDHREPVTGLRIVAPLYPNLTHVLVGRHVTARSIDQLRGLRVSVGPPGSGTEELSKQVLEAYGLRYADVTVRYLSFVESADAMKDGALDAAIISVGYPASAVLEATTTGSARLLAIDSTHRTLMEKRYPYYTDGKIPAGAYPGVTQDIPTVAVMNWIVGTEQLPASVVGHLLDLFQDDRADLIRVHDVARQIELGALAAAPIPLHPGTLTWLRNRGLFGR